ncbi:hypothetical protein KBT16_29110 [Nostoc sp. CCCryo 231-06]|nr:hypothetical protein [Nostoc sp. CCCryo 231-06]
MGYISLTHATRSAIALSGKLQGRYSFRVTPRSHFGQTSRAIGILRTTFRKGDRQNNNCDHKGRVARRNHFSEE